MKERDLEDDHAPVRERRGRRPRLHAHRRERPRRAEREHDVRQSRRPPRPRAALPAARPRRPLASPRLLLPARARLRGRRRGAPPAGARAPHGARAPATRSPSRTWRCAAPATCSAPSSRATCTPSGSTCICACSTRRCSGSCAATRAPKLAAGRRLDGHARPTCRTTTSSRRRPSSTSTSGSRASTTAEEIEALRAELRDRFGAAARAGRGDASPWRCCGSSGGLLGIEGILVRGEEARITFRDSAVPRMKGTLGGVSRGPVPGGSAPCAPALAQAHAARGRPAPRRARARTACGRLTLRFILPRRQSSNETFFAPRPRAQRDNPCRLRRAQEALTAHVDVVAKAGSQELSVTRLGDLLGNAKLRLPVNKDVATLVARDLWVPYQLLGVAAAHGDSLTDPKAIDAAAAGMLENAKLGSSWSRCAAKLPVDSGSEAGYARGEGRALRRAPHPVHGARRARRPRVKDSVRKKARERPRAGRRRRTSPTWRRSTARDNTGAEGRRPRRLPARRHGASRSATPSPRSSPARSRRSSRRSSATTSSSAAPGTRRRPSTLAQAGGRSRQVAESTVHRAGCRPPPNIAAQGRRRRHDEGLAKDPARASQRQDGARHATRAASSPRAVSRWCCSPSPQSAQLAQQIQAAPDSLVNAVRHEHGAARACCCSAPTARRSASDAGGARRPASRLRAGRHAELAGASASIPSRSPTARRRRPSASGSPRRASRAFLDRDHGRQAQPLPVPSPLQIVLHEQVRRQGERGRHRPCGRARRASSARPPTPRRPRSSRSRRCRCPVPWALRAAVRRAPAPRRHRQAVTRAGGDLPPAIRAARTFKAGPRVFRGLCASNSLISAAVARCSPPRSPSPLRRSSPRRRHGSRGAGRGRARHPARPRRRGRRRRRHHAVESAGAPDPEAAGGRHASHRQRRLRHLPRSRVVNELVDEELLLQKAKDLKIEVADADVSNTVDRQIKEIREQFGTRGRIPDRAAEGRLRHAGRIPALARSTA